MMAKTTRWVMVSLLVLFVAGPALAAPNEKAPQTTSSSRSESSEPKQQSNLSTASEEKSFSPQESLIASLTIFVLAVFVGFEIIAKVPPTLHTPLMSGSNAISGITVVGALLAAGFGQSTTLVALLGMLAVALAMINVVGGFWVTHRMLQMFQRKR